LAWVLADHGGQLKNFLRQLPIPFHLNLGLSCAAVDALGKKAPCQRLRYCDTGGKRCGRILD
jgi:hypothetical protein